MLPADPGSFRDPASRVLIDGDRVIRLLDPRGLQAWEALAGSQFHGEAVARGDLVASHPVDDPTGGAAGALEHPRLPMITYPYEWTFSMMRAAALLQLDLMEGALEDGLTIKDATPFNIQFDRGRPVFIDIGSFETYQPGEPWLGYRQFTRQFLFPLLMRSWAGVPFQPWLRGDPEGPTAAHMRAMLGPVRRLRPAALVHVVLQARMEARLKGTAVRSRLGEAGFNAGMILANVRRLRSLVASLSWDPEDGGWSGYQECAHVTRDRDHKAAFLVSALDELAPDSVLDLGANDGHFSRLAAQLGAHVVAVDGDEAVLDRLYLGLDGLPVSVVVADLTNPAPSQGWRGQERPGLFQRVRPDMVIAYGLVHHLIYTASVPPASVVEWLRGFEVPIVLEFVAPGDEMVAVLTANKLDSELHPGRTEAEFRTLLAGHFEVEAEETLAEGFRTLLRLSPR